MNKKLKVSVMTFLIAWVVGMGGLRSDAAADVVVIVNKTNPVTAVKKSALARYFFKKTTAWDHGTKVVPIDLKADDPVRAEFSDKILESSPKKVESYWISESITGGKSAPEIVSGAAIAKKRVAAEPGGVGYVDRSEADDSVKIIEIVE